MLPSPISTSTSLARILTLAAATTLATACMAEPEADEMRAAILMDAIDDAAPAEARSISPTPPTPTSPSDAAATDFNGESCSLEARPAALVGIVNQHGRQLSGIEDDASLIYTHREPSGEWSEPVEGLCIDANCERWAIGYASPGEYMIGAFACDDYELARLRVGMTEDGCHVDTVTTRLALELETSCMTADEIDPVEPDLERCELTEPLSPSVIAMTGVIKQDMVIPKVPDELTLTHGSDGKAQTMDCLDEGCTSFVSEHSGVPGEFRLRAEMCGDAITRSVSVEPSEDGCDVETEWVGVYTQAEQCAVFDYDDAQ